MDLLSKSNTCELSDFLISEAFPTELELVDKFERLFDGFLNSGVLVEREFDCGFGIADAVIFKYYEKKSFRDLAKVPPEWAYTLRVLPYRKNFSLELLTNLSCTSISVSKKAINNFIDAGFCKEKSKNVFIKTKQPRVISHSIIAVEAKLRDWKKAIWQASRYKTFANESWVLLDEKHSNPAINNIAEFKKFNIGLATFSTNGYYDVHFSPRKEMHKSEIAFWKANTLLAKRIYS